MRATAKQASPERLPRTPRVAGARRVILFNKPYGVVSQFTAHATHRCLKDFIAVPGVYPAGRLDWDSEGLLVLTDDGALQQRISNPASKSPKTYWVQIEGVPDDDSLGRLRQGVMLRDGMTLAAQVQRMPQPAGLWPRNPPIRQRQAIATTWLEITLAEGRNRQVRRMTAAVGHPTLRLVRWRVGEWTVEGIPPGEYRSATA